MALDERAILTGFDDSGMLSRDSAETKLQDQARPLESTQTGENQCNSSKKNDESVIKEPRQTCNEKLKRKQSQENIHPEKMQIYRTDQPEEKEVFLPRLASSSRRNSPDNRSQDGKEKHLRLPEIRIVSNNLSMLALNRSITDLLDPEMEILNKIKHGPRRKKKKRRSRIVHNTENQDQ